MIQRKQLVKDLMAEFATIKRIGAGHDHMLSRFDLTRPQIGVLMLLEQRRILTVGQVAELMGVSNGAATQMLEIMVRRELIARVPDPDDRRVIRLDMTAAGKKLAGEVREVMTEHMSDLVAELSEQELDQFVNVMRKLNQAMERKVAKNRE